MSKSCLMALLVLVFLIVPVIPSAHGDGDAGAGDSNRVTSPQPSADSSADAQGPGADAYGSSNLGKQYVDIVVFTTDAGELGRALRSIPHKGSVGTAGGSGPSTPRIQIPSWAVDIVKSLPSTIGVYDYKEPERHLYDSKEVMSGAAVNPSNVDAVNNHQAPAAWARGYKGEGVEVAIVDDGVDFAHPDLMGTIARYNVSEINNSALNTKPWLTTYDGWPISYDPTSMGAYFTSGGKAEGGWYANTSSTDNTVWHTVRIDGKNDFWTDGSENVATDINDDIVEINGTERRQDYNLVDLWVTQDLNNWFFGFTSKANHSSLNFGMYINTTTATPGATFDPLGNHITTVANHSPEFAVYMTHLGGQPAGHYDKNDTIDNATVWKWAGSAWGAPVNVTDPPISGQFSYGKYDFKKGVGWVEFSIPKAYLGNPPAISVELFTTGMNVSHAQDTCYEDPNVNFAFPDWSGTTTQLSAFTEVGRSSWHHTRNEAGDRATFTWPIQYVTAGITSKSGKFYFGDHPDKNLPQTRILVVDEAVAGVYDTVYVDLDHNKDFSNDKPLKKYGKYDDATKTWHPADWSGQGKIYDETSYMDFYDPGGAVRSLAFSPSGRWMASGGEDHQVILWDTLNWAIKWSINPEDGRPVSLAFSPDSSKVAAGFDDESGGRHWILVFDVLTGNILDTYKGHTASVNALAWSQDGNKIASASSDGTAHVWDTTGGPTLILGGHTGAVTGVAWRWGDNTVATSSVDGTARFWNGTTGAQKRVFANGHPLTSIDFNPSGTMFATSSSDGNVTLWDAATSANVSEGPAHYYNPVWSVRFNSTGLGLVSSSSVTGPFQVPLVVWSTDSLSNFFPTQKQSACDESGKGYGSSMSVFAPNATQIVSGCDSSAIKLWDSALDPQGTLRGHRVGVVDYNRWDAGDGLPDVSGATMYFIAQNYYYPATKTWGTPIPYSDTYKMRNGQEILFIPANGTLVAFTGDLDLNTKHGTLMASSIVGRGMSRYYDSTSTIAYPMTKPTAPQVVGIAPAVKIIPVADVYTGSIFEGWWFTAQGYDGAPNTGDEPQIVANSFGFSSTFEDGWDFYSRFADWITMVYAGGHVVFTVSSGNDGNGYGTVTSHDSGAGVITVGASTDFYYRRTSGLEGGSSPSYGDVVPFSGRGPTALGVPDPDVLANGRMSYGSTPLNLVVPYNGQIASELWSGTSLSSPLAAGILALAEQAYKQKNGQWPDASTAKSLLMSSSDDINYDVFSQGAGFLNADRATKLAAGLEGFLVTPSLWTPGNYSGKKYEAFTAQLDPNSSDSTTFTVYNSDPANPKDANLSTEIFHKFAELDFAINALADSTGAALDNYVTLVAMSQATTTLGGPGAYLFVPPTAMRKRATLSVGDWISADLLRITIYANFTALDGDHDGALGGTKDFTYDLDIYDWTWDGNPPPRIHIDKFQDLNRVTINHPTANVVQATVHNPAIRTHDGLTLGIRQFPKGAKDIYFRITVEFFNRTSWSPFLTLDRSSVTVPTGSSATFDATVTVPAGTPIGSYEGAIYVKGNPQRSVKTLDVNIANPKYMALDHFNLKTVNVKRSGTPWVENTNYRVYRDTGVLEFITGISPGMNVTVDYTYDQVVTIPVSVTVPAHGIIFSWPGGLVPGQDELYSNMISSGFGNGGQSGDWRFYPTILPEGGLYDVTKTLRFLTRVTWDFNLTDIDVFAFGQGGSVAPVGSDLSTDRYGPFLVGRNNGGSATTSLIFTTTGRNMEIASPGLAGGLNVIAVHVVHMNGTAYRENVSGAVGLFGLNPKEITVVTNKLYGSRTLQIFSSMDWPGVGSVSAGPAPPERYLNEHIKQDSTEGTDFVSILAKGSYTRLVRVKPSALIFSANISSDTGYTDRQCKDLDLGVFLDGKGPGNKPDGIAQPEEFVVYSAGSSPTEEVRLIRPVVEDDPDTPEINEMDVGSPYLIKVLGYDVPWTPFGTFNMDVTLVQGVGFSVEGVSSLKVEPFNITQITLKWNLPGSTKPGRMLGAIYVGPSDAPLMILVPVTLVIDFTPPQITGFSVSATGDNRVDAATGRTTNDRMPNFVVEVGDLERGELDPYDVRVSLDGQDVSSWVSVAFAYTQNPAGLVWGRWSGSVSFVPLKPLDDGPHSFRVSISDIAGNRIERDYFVVVDTRAPTLAVEGSRTIHTNLSQITVRGATEPRATVAIGGTSIVAGTDGKFSFDVQLSPGLNKITVKATDWFATSGGGVLVSGNSAELEITVISDTIAPVLQASILPALNTNQESVKIWGYVSDTAEGMSLDPASVRVTVNGDTALVGSDGYFVYWFTLNHEGHNQIRILAVDLAGNAVSKDIIVTRDSQPPALVLGDMPGIVTDGKVLVRGKTDPGMIVRIDGFDTTVAADGSFGREVQLSNGMNYIVIRAADGAGNAVERRVGVYYASPFRPEAGGPGGYLGQSPGMWAAVLVVVGIIIGLLLAFLFKKGPLIPGKGASEEGEAKEEAKGETPRAEEPAKKEEVSPPPEGPARPIEEQREAALRKAFEDGKISKEVYEKNLNRLREKAVPVQVVTKTAADEKAEKLRKLFEEGKISEEVYQENMKRLKGAA